MTAPGAPTSGGPPARLRAWVEESLAHRLAVVTTVLAVAVLVPAVGLSLTLSVRLLEREREARLDARADLAASQLSMALVAARENLAELAASPFLSTALVDAQGWQQYGAPFLRGHRLPVPVETRLALCDFRGRIIASGAAPPSLESIDWVDAVIGRGEWRAVLHGSGALTHVLVIAPVPYPGSGSVEGALVAEIPLAGLAGPATALDGPVRLVDGEGRPLLGDPPGHLGALARERAPDLPAPFAALGLRIQAAPTPGRFARQVALVVLGHLAAAATVLGLGLWLARRMALRLTGPLATLAEAARASVADVAARRLPVTGVDEVGQVATAFNELLARLEASQAATEAALRSEQRETAEALRLAHGALEHSNDAITIDEPSGRIAYLNEAACRLLGRPREQLLGRRTFEVDPNLTEERWHQLWAVLRATGRHSAERSVPAAEGPARWIEVAVHLVRRGEAEYCVSVMRDVSARRQAEAALRLAGVGTLAAGAAHEINNPLTSVMGNLSFLGEELAALERSAAPDQAPLVQEARAAAREALGAAERVRDVVRGLKDFARPDEDQQAPTDLADVMRGAVQLARHEVRHVGRLVEAYQPARRVLASSRRLEQVFLNLLMNAAQALREGGGDGEVAVSVRPGLNEEVVAEVRDDGAGMAPEVRARIFEPFFTTRPVGQGTGLGLAICHGIVASCGGRIEVESESGCGSAFRVVLPAMAELTGDAAGLAAAERRPEGAADPTLIALPAGRRILVIDDEPAVLRVVARALAGGPEVLTVADPHEAQRRLLAGERFDLVLCDLMMPGLSGMDLHASLAQARPDLAARMLFITGGAFTDRARTFLAQGRHPLLEKPFEPAALRRLVAERLLGTPALA